MAMDPLLDGEDTSVVRGAVHHSGRLADRRANGRWRAALYVIGAEAGERFAYFAVSSNLITYLTGPLRQTTAAAAATVNLWSGAVYMLPLVGAMVADQWLGRYRTVLCSCALYILGLGALALVGEDPSPSAAQSAAFYAALCAVAIAEGGHRPCLQSFGADQFDQSDEAEAGSMSSFFNWWNFCGSAAITVSRIFMSYVQDNVGWGVGFGIPCAAMIAGLALLLLGTKSYRFYYAGKADHPRSAGKASQAEIHAILRLLPIWATCLMYTVCSSQLSTTFTKLAATLDRRIGGTFRVPPASLQSLQNVTLVAVIPFYDRVLVPLVRKIRRKPSGITALERIGIGQFLAAASLAMAAAVEMRRLGVARASGLVDSPDMAVPMSLWWMLPQYITFGVADVFTMVGAQEFFYSEAPATLRSLGSALFMSIMGVGELMSALLVLAVDRVTSESGQSWLAANLNRAHLDYFYWLVAALTAGETLLFLHFSRQFASNKQALCSSAIAHGAHSAP